MNFGWESEEERLKRHLRMAPKKKLELLREITAFTRKYSVKKNSKALRKLR